MEWKRLTRQQLVSVIMYNIITRVITPLPTARARSQPAAQNQNQRYHRRADTESVFPLHPHTCNQYHNLESKISQNPSDN